MLKWLMIYLVYEQELKMYVASSVDSLSKQKRSDSSKVSYEELFILFYISNLSPRNVIL
jgi:hypothetical protein